MGSQFNIRDLPERTAQQIKDLADRTGYTKTQIVLIAIENLWKEVRKEQNMLGKTLEQYLKSEDFKQGVISSTKASWGGSCYKVEIMPDGTWRNLWANQIGNRYETEGVILALPALDCEDMATFTDNGGTEEEYFSLSFNNERDQLEAELRYALKTNS